MKKQKITYEQVGDNYKTKDPINKIFQIVAKQTGVNLKKYGFSEIEETRGESAFVWKQGNVYMASVIECLGTKSLIADAMREITGQTYYDVIAQDTVATFINDLSSVGAKPLVVHAFWSVDDNSWLEDRKRMIDFIYGWQKACDLAGAARGGGETATSKGIICRKAVNLAGSAVGIIKSKKRLLLGSRLKAGDRILLLKSNGVNANGISLTRDIAKKLPKGYATKLTNGRLYGEALLTPTNIYARLVQDLLDSGIDLHYITNITGHGLRKIMRAKQSFTYTLEKIFEPQEVFSFIQKQACLADREIYETYNMGMDYALFVAKKDVFKAQEIIDKNGFRSLEAGFITRGKRRVIIRPKKLVFEADSLNLR